MLEIFRLSVDSKMRGRGVALKLVDKVLQVNDHHDEGEDGDDEGRDQDDHDHCNGDRGVAVQSCWSASFIRGIMTGVILILTRFFI